MIKDLQAQPAIRKQPTVLMVATNNTFQQIHDYTQNRDELIEAVKKHTPEPWRMMNSSKTGPGAVERMAQVMAALRRNKSARPPPGHQAAKTLSGSATDSPLPNLVGLDQTQADLIEAAMRRATTRLLAARITMYIINPTASTTTVVEVDTPDDLNYDVDENGRDPFNAGTVTFTNFAPSTGGIAFTGRNDLKPSPRSRQRSGLLHALLLANQHLPKLERPRKIPQHPHRRRRTHPSRNHPRRRLSRDRRRP